jgi:hypothetical protein
MAPPIPRPAGRRRRSPADLFLGLLALAVLAALTAGVPLALVMLFGLPIPHTIPRLSVLTRQLDVATILRVLSLLVWLAWIQLVWCVIAEIRGAVRNAGTPARVPLAGGTQVVVHRLVTAALLVCAATAALSPALGYQASGAAHPVSTGGPGHRAGSQPRRPDAVAPQLARPPEVAHSPDTALSPHAAQSSQKHHEQRKAHGPRAAHESPGQKIYVVRPPAGRFHESLWEIAEKYLGDGRRYREIFALNSGRLQPDGSRLTIASLIRPGWVLYMPRDAEGPGIESVSAPAADHSADGQGRTVPDGGPLGGAHPRRAVDHQPAPGQPSWPGPGGHRTSVDQRRPGPGYPHELAAAALLCTGLLAALGRRRREQLWRRAFGRVVAPEGEPALAESALRAGANKPSARLLDSGLRCLSYALTQTGRPAPTLFAAHLSQQNLDLWIAPADLDAPPPWTAVGDGQVWRLPFTALHRVDTGEAADAPALFPGLVSIGTNDTGRVLVDLAAAHGLISVTGPQHMIIAVLSSMAMELAANRWSGRMRLTLVGFGADLTSLAPDRVTTVDTLDEALPALEARAAQVVGAMASTGSGAAAAGAWPSSGTDDRAPHYLITAVPPTLPQRSRLLALARVREAAAAGYVVAGDVPGAAWTWEVTAEGRLLAGLLGLDVQAQLVPVRQQQAVLQLFEAAAQTEGVPLSAPPADAAPPEQLDPSAVMPVEIIILGPPSVRAPGLLDPAWVGPVTELLVYLATHPGGVHPDVLTATIWPCGVAPQAREAVVDQARQWLGADSIGRPHLAEDATGRLRLGSGVRVDWQVFRALAGHAALAPRGSAAEAGYLARALDLVRGQFLDGQDAGGYAWLAGDGLEYEVAARVADAAHRLAALRLMDGDPAGAMDAARAGLRLAVSDELLWQDLLRSAHATGHEHLVRAVLDELCARGRPNGGRGRQRLSSGPV